MYRFSTILILIVLTLFTSCSIERKMAKQFNNNAENISILALKTDYIFKMADKGSETLNNNVTEREADSIMMANTLVLKHIDDDNELLDLFFDNFTNELKRYGLNVFLQNEIESFVAIDTNAWIVNLAQMELEEFDYPFQDSEAINGTLYTFDYVINGLIFNTWFELSKVNEVDDIKPEILFASNYIYDEFTGYFVQNFFTGEVSYRITHDTITMSSFLEFTAYMGRLYAAYTYDYLLNNHLSKHVSTDRRSNLWYRYDPYRRMIFTTEEDKFIRLDD